jgi:Fe-S cluster assembly protein SufD
MTSLASRSLPFAYAERFEGMRASLPGRSAPWLAALRDEAMERFRAQGLPSVRVEEWKFTSLR